MIYRRKPRSNQGRLSALSVADKYVSSVDAQKLPINAEMIDRIQETNTDYRNSLLERNRLYNRTLNANRARAAAREKLRGVVSAFMEHFRTMTRNGWIDPAEHHYFGISATDSIETPRRLDLLSTWVRTVIEGEKKRKADGCEALQQPDLKQLEDEFEAFNIAVAKFLSVNQDYQEANRIFVALLTVVDDFIAELWSLLEALYFRLPKPARRGMLRKYGVAYVSSSGESINPEQAPVDADFDSQPDGPSAPDFDEVFNTDATAAESEATGIGDPPEGQDDDDPTGS